MTFPANAEYWELVGGWFGSHRLHPRLAGEYDGVDSLMAAVAAGLGVAVVASRKGRPVPERVCLKSLSPAPPPLCIAVGQRSDRAADLALAVFVAELRKAATRF